MVKYTVQITVEVPDEDDTIGHVESWFTYAIEAALEEDDMPAEHVEVVRI